MGRRTNPLALRLKSVMNWPSNVSHPFLQQYVKHIFQHNIVGTPGIRASTNAIWINVTIFEMNKKNPITSHPKYKEPILEFKGANLKKAFGNMEIRQRSLTNSHPFYKQIFRTIPIKSLMDANLNGNNVNEALQIYKDIPIRMKINVIANPLLNAEIMSKHVANALQTGAPLAKVFKSYLQSMR